jgi:hypothetical protein
MADETAKSTFEQIVDVLLAHGVEFIVIGGQAERLYGSTRPAPDIELLYRRTPDNTFRLLAAINDIRAGLQDSGGQPSDGEDASVLESGGRLEVRTDHGYLRLFGELEPLGATRSSQAKLRFASWSNVVSGSSICTI